MTEQGFGYICIWLDNPLMLLRNVVAAEPARSGFGKIKKSICQSILSKHNPIQSTYVVAVDCKGSWLRQPGGQVIIRNESEVYLYPDYDTEHILNLDFTDKHDC